MKRNLQVYYGIFVLLLSCLSGCTGKSQDIIGISSSEVTVDASAGTVELTTKGAFDIDWVRYSTDKTEDELSLRGNRNGDEYNYTGPWFTIRTSDERHRLIIDLKENTTGIGRSLSIQIFSLDYFQWVNVSQSAE